jgi:hypothetical protein
MSGCADEPAPAPAPTPVPTTVPPTTTVAPTPTLTATCQDLLASANADVAFMNSLKENFVYSRVQSLAYTSCNRMAASNTNQIIVDGPKPKTPALLEARQNLLSAAGYCFDPESSASQGRTKDDLEKYIGKMSEYSELVYSCTDRFDANVSSSLETSLKNQGVIYFRGTGDHTEHFTAASEGRRMFSMSYAGTGDFYVSLQDVHGKTTVLHANTVGPFTGKKSEVLTTGTYKVDVKASGPWTVSIINP